MTEITFRDARMETGQLIIDIPYDQRGAVMSFLRKKKDKLYEMDIKEHRKKRSLDANAKAWALINEMAVLLRVPPNEIYQGYIPDVGGNFKFLPSRPEDVDAWTRDWCKGHIGRMVEDLGPCRLKDLEGYHTLKMYHGSSDYDTAQMSRLLDLIIQDCKQLGIETLSEREKSLLLEEWDNAKRHESAGLPKEDQGKDR